MKNILSIAGTDPSGGAGIQADLKSIAALGGYGMCAITSLVAQNTHGVRSIHTPPVSFLREQLDVVSDDVQIAAVKIGMLGNVDIVETVAGWLADVKPAIVVLDPVMVATSGDRLLDKNATEAVINLLDQASMVTPNLPELAILVDQAPATTWEAALAQGQQLAQAHQVGVIVKGGHLDGELCPDALVLPEQEPVAVSRPRVQTQNTHGTGCSMSAGLATLQAQYQDWEKAFLGVKDWLQSALEHADDLNVGSGHGPVNHFYSLYQQAGLAY